MRFMFSFLGAGLLAAAADHAVIQKDRGFSQTEITVRAGETITFKNRDEIVHNVFSSTPGMEFDIRRQAPGGQSTIPFPKPGMAEVRCAIHPRMKLVVKVEPK